MIDPYAVGPKCNHKPIVSEELASELVAVVFQVSKENRTANWTAIKTKFRKGFEELLESWELYQ